MTSATPYAKARQSILRKMQAAAAVNLKLEVKICVDRRLKNFLRLFRLNLVLHTSLLVEPSFVRTTQLTHAIKKSFRNKRKLTGIIRSFGSLKGIKSEDTPRFNRSLGAEGSNSPRERQRNRILFA